MTPSSPVVPEPSYSDQSDLELLAVWRGRVAPQANRAGRALFQRYRGYLTRFFCNKTCGSDPADLVSETFLQLTRSKTPVTDNFAAYLTAIARNVLRNYYRTIARRNRHIASGELDLERVRVRDLDARSMSSLAAEAQALQVFIDALRGISSASQVVLELKYFEGLSDEALARCLELPRTAVPGRVARAVAELRREVALLTPDRQGVWDFEGQLASWAEQIQARLHPEGRG